MKKIVLFIFSSLVVSKLIAQPTIDVIHYKHQIAVSDFNDTIEGISTITFSKLPASGSIIFDLTGITPDGKGMKITNLLATSLSSSSIPFSHIEDQIRISVDKLIRKGDSSSVTILYSGIPADGLIISKNKFGEKTFFSDNWPNRAHHWIPCVDNPADKATVEFVVTAPSHYQVVSNGIQIEETNLPNNKKLTHWKEDVPLPTKVMVIGVADFAVNHAGMVDCIPVSSWVFPENRTEGFGDYAPAKDVLQWFINYIGPYAFKKLANVQSKTMFGGMENASAIFYFENSVNGKKSEEALIAHEIVHQWFGNSATEKSFAHLWLSEGFATYLTHVYIESKYGTDSLQARMKNEREEVIAYGKLNPGAVVDNTTDYMSLLNANSYQKGGWVLHMLRREIGDSIFKKAVRKYYELYAFKNADTDDFRKVVEAVSGKDLKQFFKQWLFTGENPKLAIEGKFDSKYNKVYITVKQLQPTLFRFSLPIKFEIAENFKHPSPLLDISRKEETFSIKLNPNSKLVNIIPDPNTSLLAEFSIKKIK
ncbi:MAG: hypothetical protein RIR12_806 [Bacteroidota bacterium]|jgi:aminopeptidase N